MTQVDTTSHPAPDVLPYATPAPERRLPLRPGAVFGLAGTVPLVTMLLGALTNAFNGAIGAIYFVAVMRWDIDSDIWSMAIAQGMLEGILWGIAYGIVFSSAIAMITAARCPYRIALRTLLRIAGIALVCWMIGGLLGMLLAALSPEMFSRTFIRVPSNFGDMLRYAWVGGSIWGLLIGGLGATVLSLGLFRIRWKEHGAMIVREVNSSEGDLG